MTLKLKSTTNELWKGWNLAWYHHFTHMACAKSREDYGKNWMHFVYKLDTLFRSIRVSDENSSVTKTLLHFKLITTLDFLCVHYAPFKATSSTFNPLCLHLLFFMHLLICFELNDPEIEKHYKWTLKRLKHVMVSSFHPHGMRKKVERFTAKTWWTSCTNCTISFEVSGFRTKTHLLQRPALHFFKLITTPNFFAFSMRHSKSRHQLSTLSDIICYFSCIYWFFELNDPEI